MKTIFFQPTYSIPNWNSFRNAFRVGFLSFILLLAYTAQGANVYVSTSSGLASACSGASSGDVILIAAGTYTGPFVLSGKTNVTLKSYNGTVNLEGSSSTGTNGINILHITNSTNIVVDGLVFRNNWGNTGNGIIVNGTGNEIDITNCEFYNIGWTNSKTTMPTSGENAHAIVIVGSTSSAIENVFIGGNSVHDCITGYSESITLVGNVQNFLVEGNTLDGNTNIGIDAAGHFSWTGAPASVNYARSGIIRENVVKNYAGPAALDAAGGIYVDGGSYITIENNIVFNYKVGFSVGCEVAGKSSTGNIVRNNLAYDCTLSGLFLGSNTTSTVSGTQVYNNTFYKCGTGTYDNGQIALQNNTSSVIKNNIMYPTDWRYAIVQMGGTTTTSHTLAYNLYWRDNANTSSLFYNVSGDANSVKQNPLFVNAGSDNYSISSSSPAIDAGDPSFTGSGQEDLAGNARKQGSAVDIGAYEIAAPLNITVDGATSDWASVSTIATGGTNLTSLKAADNASNFYVLAQGSFSTHYQVFLDTDNNTSGSNEYTSSRWSSTGFNYMIENGTLYQYTGTGSSWSWSSLGGITAVKNSSVLELSVAKSSLGISGSVVRVAVASLNSGYSIVGFIPSGTSGAAYTIGSAGSRVAEEVSVALSDKLSIFPNPATDYIMISHVQDEEGGVVIEVIGMDGKKHTEWSGLLPKGSYEHELSVMGLPKGMALVRVTANGETMVKKIIIR
ncbi:MAG: choice-of-anchor Q domain-containing protein [Marinoscillum sp.]|uniref:choice-of-anchor Q domain-containing protein n=1 Tax=Marinoscillum sp. TaxID=2024838 RepID=UPI0032FDBB12